MPISLEAFMLAIAEKLGLPGFGSDGFGNGKDFRRPDDFYLRCAANIAFGEKEDTSEAVPEASEEELNIFIQARQHLPKSVFDIEKWRKAAGPHWRRVVYVLNRGGRYQEYEKAFDGDQVKNRYAKQVNIYSEKVAKSTDSMTGRPLPGIATYIPIADSLGRSVANPGDREFLLVTYREIFHTKSRTPGNVWLKELYPENSILINKLDADLQGLKTGMSVRIASNSNPEGVWDLPNFGKKPMVGRIKVTQGIRPAVIAFSLGHGHWAYGASDVTIDGKLIAGDPGRGAGIHANAAMMVDPQLKNVCLQDLVGGSASFYDSIVRLEKV